MKETTTFSKLDLDFLNAFIILNYPESFRNWSYFSGEKPSRGFYKPMTRLWLLAI